ncbi:hypothetical protein [Faecalibacter macacae]|nr:hypothetical protein [Faecalibacter macacae]
MSKKKQENHLEVLINKLKDPTYKLLKSTNREKKRRRNNAKS